MRLAVKPFLLSAFVFPGLGQLYKEDRMKGVLLLVSANLLLALLLLAGVMVFSQEYMTAVYPAALNAENLRVLFKLVISRPLFYLPAAIFLAIWGFAAMDAAFATGPPQEDKE
jgi:TM2 domain-containing membrane protein YozV